MSSGASKKVPVSVLLLSSRGIKFLEVAQVETKNPRLLSGKTFLFPTPTSFLRIPGYRRLDPLAYEEIEGT